MAKTITVTGSSSLDTAQRAESLQYLNKELTTAELMKLKKFTADPTMRSMFKSL